MDNLKKSTKITKISYLKKNSVHFSLVYINYKLINRNTNNFVFLIEKKYFKKLEFFHETDPDQNKTDPQHCL